MLKRKKRGTPEVNSSSMADIAFLLLIFFLVTTTIASDKGLPILLPPEKKEDIEVEIKDKNVFKVLINSRDKLSVEDEPMDIRDLKEECKIFLDNRGRNPELSDSPQDAVVSIKTDRGTSYEMYINVMDNLRAAYHELRAEHLNITIGDYLLLDKSDSRQKQMYNRARKEYPLQISEAEPDNR